MKWVILIRLRFVQICLVVFTCTTAFFSTSSCGVPLSTWCLGISFQLFFCITWTVKALYLEYNMQPCKIFLHWSYTCSSFCVSISMLAEILLIATNIIHGILKFDREQIFSPKSSDLKTERLGQV